MYIKGETGIEEGSMNKYPVHWIYSKRYLGASRIGGVHNLKLPYSTPDPNEKKAPIAVKSQNHEIRSVIQRP
jgi:hypothetical protein